MLVDQALGLAVKFPGLWRCSTSPHLCLARK